MKTVFHMFESSRIYYLYVSLASGMSDILDTQGFESHNGRNTGSWMGNSGPYFQ
jgi:hypothetical protein